MKQIIDLDLAAVACATVTPDGRIALDLSRLDRRAIVHIARALEIFAASGQIGPAPDDVRDAAAFDRHAAATLVPLAGALVAELTRRGQPLGSDPTDTDGY